MADGSIVFDTRIDNAQAVKDLQKLNNRIKTLTQQIETKSALRLPIAEQAKEMAAALDAAKATLESMKSAPTGSFTAEQITDQAENVKALQAEWSKVQAKVDSYDASINRATAEMEVLKTQSGNIQAAMASAGVDTEKMAVATKKASKNAMSFARQMKFALSSILLYGTLFSIFATFTEWVRKIIMVNNEASAAVARLKGALLTLAQPIISVVIPALTFLANVLSRVISVIASFVSMVFGSTLEESASAAEGLYNEAEALDAVGESAKDANKQLASFDEINKLSGGTESGGGAAASDTIAPDFEDGGNIDWLKEFLGEAAGWVTAALLIGGIALVAIGAATGRISLVLAGLLMLGSGITVGEETGVLDDWAKKLGLENADQFISAALAIGGIALIVIGAAMLNILLVIAGLGLIGTAIFYVKETGNAGYWKDKLGLDSVFDYVGAALQLAGIAIIVMGAAMLNIFMVIAGALLLGTGIALQSIDEQTLSDWWEKLKLTSVQQWVAVALLLGGIALIVIGAAMANILMILAGFALLAVGTVASANEGNLKDWVSILGLEKAAGWVTAGLLIGGIALVIFGILTANIFMVLAGLGLLGAGISIGVTSGTFSDWLNTIADAFSAFARTVKNIFKGLWDGIRGVINSILGGIEAMANGVINGINWVIDALNNLSFTVPEWVPGIGGESFGFSIPRLSNVELPRLAQGAVIPPNREFLAVLGDQKNGTNIETPLSTMVQAFKQALSESGYFGGRNEAYLVLDEQVLGKVVYRLNNKESRRVGVRLSGV